MLVRVAFCIALGAALPGCGLFVPEMQPFFKSRTEELAFENIIVNNIKCELRHAVVETQRRLATRHSPHPGNDISWLEQQGATVSLKLAVDEKSALNPGMTYTDTPPLPFSLGLGSSNSVDATRTEIIAFTYSFYDLLHQRGIDLTAPCENEDGVFIQSDLKIKDFILAKVLLAKVPGSVLIGDVPGKRATPVASPFSTFSYQATFVASYGVSASPSWKFTRVAVNPSGTFFSTSQQRTQDLTITIGKTARATATRPATPSPEAIALHNAALIGQAVATAIQSQSH
jgi:hypothetical protein